MTSTTAAPSVLARRSWWTPLAAAWSGAAALTGGWWLAVPDRYPQHLAIGGEQQGSLAALLHPTVVSTLLAVLGGLGVLVALRARAEEGRASALVGVVGLGYAGVFGLLATDMSLLVSMGYTAAILGPPVLLGILVAASVHRPGLRWVVGGVLAGGVLTAATFGVDADAMAEFGRELSAGIARAGVGMLLVLLSFLGGVVWLGVGLRALGLRRPEESAAAASYRRPRRDWGWWVTVLAAAGPLPYAALRMTWLTPWPFWMSAAELEAHPATRVFGLSLGFAAIGASVLTAGLLLRWGSVYPRWLPWLAGRPVSPTWPTALAVVVGVAITVAGRSMVQLALQGAVLPLEAVETLLILPFWAWGPLLVAAGVAYYRRRTGPRRDR